MANRLIDVVRNAVHVLDGMRVLAVRCREFDLAFLLEATHAVLIHRRRATDQDHRPAVLLGVGEPREGVNHAGAGDRQTALRSTGQITRGMGRIARGLLVAHADVGDARLLRFRRETLYREADDAEDVVDPLLLQTARHQLRAVDFCHVFPQLD